MKIEVVSLEGCPHHTAAVAAARALLAEAGLRTEVEEILIRDEAGARTWGLRSSPTVRINGHDVEPLEGPAALACRWYAGGRGAPPHLALQAALRAALEQERRRP